MPMTRCDSGCSNTSLSGTMSILSFPAIVASNSHCNARRLNRKAPVLSPPAPK